MTRDKRSFFKRSVDILTSMRLTIFILIILAATSIFSIVFQEYHPTNFYNWENHYATNMNPVIYKISAAFQLFTPYHSWWFIGLLMLLCLSLLLCSINRIRGVIKFIAGKSDFRSKDKISRQKNFYSFKINENSSLALISHALKHRFYNVSIKKKDNETFVYAKKGSLSRLGPFLSHVGLLALFVGGLVSAFAGKSDMLWGAAGDTISAPFADHRLKINNFSIVYNARGEIKDYITDLKVIDENDSAVVTKQVEVNHPLRYAGISYYQASYRLHPRKLKRAVLALSSGSYADTLNVAFGAITPVKGTNYSLLLSDFTADFQITQKGVISKSEQLGNPALLLKYYENGEELGHEWLFANFPAVHTSKNLPLKSDLIDFEPLYYTGLQAAKNPGSYFIWSGFLIMTLGLVLVFYLNHQQIWITILHTPGERDKAFLAGTSHKFKDHFKREVKKIVEKIKSQNPDVGGKKQTNKVAVSN